MLYAVLLGILIFLSGWGIVFIVSFAHGPVALDAENQRAIKALSQKLELPDKALAAHLRRLLETVGPKGQEIARFLLFDDDEIAYDQIKVSFSNEEKSESLQLCTDEGLLKARHEPYGPYDMMIRSFYWLPSGFRPTLKILLYRPENALSLPSSRPKSSN